MFRGYVLCILFICLLLFWCLRLRGYVSFIYVVTIAGVVVTHHAYGLWFSVPRDTRIELS